VRESAGARRQRDFSPELPGAMGSRPNSGDSNFFLDGGAAIRPKAVGLCQPLNLVAIRPFCWTTALQSKKTNKIGGQKIYGKTLDCNATTRTKKTFSLCATKLALYSHHAISTRAGARTGWRQGIGCLIFTGLFSYESPLISGSFAESDLPLKASDTP